MSIHRSRFCLNRIICPTLDLEDFFRLAGELGFTAVELRNDLPGGKIMDGLPQERVKTLADGHGIRILTINAVQKFNLSAILDEVVTDVQEMLMTARSVGCKAVVLCPNNDIHDGRTASQCYQDTVAALKRIAPLFETAGIRGLVEPLGFKECSLRSKETAIKAIRESGDGVYGIVHDTFHHFLGADEKVFPAETGIVHISGVEGDMDTTQFKDQHRILIGPRDVLGNQAQIRALESQGYEGFYSFEPFGSEVQKMSPEALSNALEESLKLIQSLA